MLRGMYTSASGMLSQQKVQEMRSNNVANSNTTGFKRDIPVKRSFPNMLISRINDHESLGPHGPKTDLRPYIGELGTGVLFEETVKDFSQGTLNETDNTLDLALEGAGFFSVQGPDDETYYTRSGSLNLHSDGTLSTQQGYPVLGEEGVIQLSGEGEITVTESGEIYENDEQVANLALVNFENPQGLSRYGENLLLETEESGPPELNDEVTVHQGYIEGSNVSAVKEMSGMIEALRAYESNQKAVQAHDDALERSVNDVGRPAT